MNCIVCFEELQDTTIKCADINCLTFICVNCFNEYLNYCYESKTIPICLNPTCRCVILRKKLTGLLTTDNLQKYDDCFMLELCKNKEDTVSKKVENYIVIEKLRNERKVFIDTNFPIGISRVANIILKNKLLKLEKKKKGYC